MPRPTAVFLIQGDILSDTHVASSGPYRKPKTVKRPKVVAPRVEGEYSSPESRRPPAPSRRKQMLAAFADFGAQRT